ncbi:MAG: hypothetical protein ACFFDB_18985, partial [Promethearchaeota archaeon]
FINIKKINPNPFQKVIRIIALKSGVVLINSDDFSSLRGDVDRNKIKTQSSNCLKSKIYLHLADR